MSDIRISVSKEFYEHFEKVKGMRDLICNDQEAKDSAKVSVLNTTTTIIKDLVAMQERIHNAEKFAVLQQVVVSCLREVDKNLQQQVIKKFKERLQEL